MWRAEELIPDFERIRVMLRHDGSLHWEPGGIFRTTCDINIAYFPFDVQECHLLIGAYSYFSNRMNITNAGDNISTHDFRVNGEWHVYRTSQRYAVTILDANDSQYGYSHVVFTLNLKRRCQFYIMNIVAPCLMLSVLIMIGFFLPPDAGEKISLGISVLLAFTVFLLMIADNIPRTSLAIPLMGECTFSSVKFWNTVWKIHEHHDSFRNILYIIQVYILIFYYAWLFGHYQVQYFAWYAWDCVIYTCICILACTVGYVDVAWFR